MSRATTAACDASTCRRDALSPKNEWKTRVEVTWIGVSRFHVTLLQRMDGRMGVPSTHLNAIQSLPPPPTTWRGTVLVWHVKRRLSSSAHLGREPASVLPSPPAQAPTWCGADGANGGEWGVVQGDQRSGQNPHARASSWDVPRGAQTEHVACW